MNDTIDEIRLDIENHLQQYDKIDLLSKIYFELSHTKSKKIDIKNDVPGLQFLIGLSLKTKNAKKQKVSSEIVTKIIKLLEEYFEMFDNADEPDSYSERDALLNKKPRNLEPFSKEITSHFMQNHNLLWQINLEKYEFQHIDMLRGIFCQLDDVFKSKIGFDITNVINMGYLIHELCIMSQSAHMMHIINTQKTFLSKNVKDKKSTPKINLTMDYVVEFYIFDIRSIANQLSMPVQTAKSILNHISCEFGEQNTNYNTPLDDNLFLYKPMIRISEDKFFCPQPNALIFYLNRVFSRLLEKEKKAQTKDWEKFTRAKKRYLEERIVQYLARLFPRACIINNAQYSYKGKCYEADVLVAFDNKLIIFEAKSGMISESTKRGGVKSIERDMKNLISFASMQAQRVRSYVTESKNPVFTNSLGQHLEINEKTKQRIKFYLVNVTLESLSGITANLKMFDAFNLFNGEYPWSVDLSHLDIITEILDYPSMFIHYIENRVASQKQGMFFGMDENTLFSLYLKIGMLPHSDQEVDLMLIVPDWSEIFDDYYLKYKEKPHTEKEEFVIQLVEFLEKSRELGYTDTTSIIMDMPNRIAQKMTKQIAKTIKTVKKKNRLSDFTFISEKPSVGITFMASKNENELFKKLVSYCITKKYQAKTKRWVGISKDITNKKNNFTQILFLDGEWIYNAELEKMSKTLPEIKQNYIGMPEDID